MSSILDVAVILGGLYMSRLALKTEYDDLIIDVARNHVSRFNRAAMTKAIIKRESGFNKLAHATGGEDSRGLMQINAPTGRALGVTDLNKLYEPEYNIEIGNKLLDELEGRFDSAADVIAAFNAGSVRLKTTGEYINSSYVREVLGRYYLYSLAGV